MKNKIVDILKHTLGLNYNKKSFRNNFHADVGHDDYETLELLVAKGFMMREKNRNGAPGFTYRVTIIGKEFLNKQSTGTNE